MPGLDAGFNAERVGRDVGHHHFFQRLVLRDQSCLDGGADGDGFVRVETCRREAAKEARHGFAQHRHARRAADEDDVVQAGGAHARIAQGLFDGDAAALQQRFAAFFPVGDGNAPFERRAVVVHLHAGVAAAERLFGAFCRGVERALAVCEVNGAVRGGKALDEQFGEIFAAEHVVARAGAHFHDASVHVEQGDVEGAAAEVKHEEFLVVAALVQAVGHCRRGRFVEQTLHV